MQATDDLIRVLLVDDHPVMRQGLRTYIGSQDDMEVVGEADGGLAAVDAFLALRPSVTLMDLQMESGSGLEAISAIRSHDAHAVIVVLTTFPGEARAARALSLGASSFLLKSSSAESIIEAVRSTLAGRRVISPGVSQASAHDFTERLTGREDEVLVHIAEGATNLEIAHALGVSEQTIKSHVKSVLAKLGARDRTQAIAFARRKGLLEP